jgi:hypothetical protein
MTIRRFRRVAVGAICASTLFLGSCISGDFWRTALIAGATSTAIEFVTDGGLFDLFPNGPAGDGGAGAG